MIRNELDELLKSGALPSSTSAPERINETEELLSKITAPVTDEEARTLVELLPKDEDSCFGLVWTLIHLIETAPNWPLEECLFDTTSPWIAHLRNAAQRGNSVFRLNNATADAFGVPRGTQVRFLEGVPDYSPFVRPTPAGTSGVFDVPGLTGVHATDQDMIVRFLAEQAGTSQAAVTRYLSANNFRIHHFQGNRVQLVPYNIHRLHHTGGAAALRGGS